MFSRAKVLLPGYRLAPRELAERQHLELELEANNSKMAVSGVVVAVLILGLGLGLVILLRWRGKHQADRESALVHTLEESGQKQEQPTRRQCLSKPSETSSAWGCSP
ncbi:unnamed protein product [Ectocarpus sp. 8 AP-2014]